MSLLLVTNEMSFIYPEQIRVKLDKIDFSEIICVQGNCIDMVIDARSFRSSILFEMPKLEYTESNIDYNFVDYLDYEPFVGLHHYLNWWWIQGAGIHYYDACSDGYIQVEPKKEVECQIEFSL